MLKNYLLISLRTLKSNKLFSLINIAGLAIGIAICLLIFTFVQYELSYDKANSKSDRTYRITRHYADDNLHMAGTAAPFKDLLASRFPDIEAITLIGMGSKDVPLSKDELQINAENLIYAESSIIDVLDLKLLSGDASAILDRPGTIVLSERIAKKLFGNESPIGQFVFSYGRTPVEVTGVMEDLPHNTHLKFDVLYSIESLRGWVPEDMVNWDLNYSYVYLRLKEGVSANELDGKFPSLLSEIGQSITPDQSIKLQPIEDIHLRSNLLYEMDSNGSYVVVVSFSVIALIILLIACINFMNLSTARSLQRSKEVGVRKSTGASRTQLTLQFLFESIFITAIAMVIACALVELALPYFSNFIERPLKASDYYSFTTLIALILATLAIGVFAGSYPAFYISSFPAARALKGDLSSGLGAIFARKVLVILQFSISITLIISTTIVLQQTAFARSIDHGYDRKHNVVVKVAPAPGLGGQHETFKTLKERIDRHPNVVSTTGAQQLPTAPLRDSWSYVIGDQNMVAENMITIPTLNISFNFFEHYGVKILAGRTFSEERGDSFVTVPNAENPIGTGNAVISRSAARTLGFTPEEAVDKIIKIPFPPGSTNYRILGVVEDIHIASLHEKQGPQVFHLVKGTEYFLSIKIRSGNVQDTLKFIDDTWNEMVPTRAINRFFLDDNFNAMYRQEEKQATVFGIFSALAIFVATLGLLGLATFTTERRKKEIGIRKVLGASTLNIITLLTSEFSWLVIIANLIAWPITYFSMNKWLSTFSQAIDMSPLVFIGAGLFALIIAWLTIASQAGFVAISRPIQSLKYE